MNGIKNNRLNIFLTIMFVILYAITKFDFLVITFFSVIIILELFYLLTGKYDNVFMESVMLVPLMGITKYSGIPFFNIYNVILALYTLIFKRNIKINKKIILLYFVVIMADFVRVLLMNNGLSSLYDYASIPLLYISMLNCIYIYHNIKNYKQLKDYSTHFIIGTLLSIVYGFIVRYINGGLVFALINNSIVTRNSGASGDSNYFGLYILISVSFLIMNLFIEKKNYLKTFFLSIFMIFMGLTSTSRMYYLILTVIILLLAFLLFKSLFSKKWLTAILILSISFLFIFFLRDYINLNLDFLISRFSDSDLSNGRNAIRNSYISTLKSNPLYEMFGIGIPKYNLRSGVMAYAHNLYIEIFVCNGILGTIIIMLFFLRFIFSHLKFNNLIFGFPLLLIVIAGLSLNFIEVDCFYLLFGLVFAFLKFNKNDTILTEENKYV